jgi:hypothetical protein
MLANTGGAFGSPGSIAQDNSCEPLGWFTEQPQSSIIFAPLKSASPVQPHTLLAHLNCLLALNPICEQQ